MVSEYLKVCQEIDIQDEDSKLFTIDGKSIILAKYEGKIYALDGICNHDGGEFDDDSEVVDGQIECPRHGARFDLKTGKPTRMPAVIGINSYEVKIENGNVLVALNDK